MRAKSGSNPKRAAPPQAAGGGRRGAISILTSGWLEVPLDELGIDRERSYEVEDLLSGTSYLWQGARNYVDLNPQTCPAHVFRVKKRLRSERDFEYFA